MISFEWCKSGVLSEAKPPLFHLSIEIIAIVGVNCGDESRKEGLKGEE